MKKRPELHGLIIKSPIHTFLITNQIRMRKLAIVCFVLTLAGGLAAQTCVRDSSIIGTEQIVLPKPWSPEDSTIYTLPACINEPYAQSVTFNVPAQYVSPFGTIPVTSIDVATTGAVTGLPVGLGYSCDPPNCSFQANTLGCMLISGTPTNVNAPGDYELSIMVTINSIIQIPLEFPSGVGTGQKYFITVKNTGECTSGTSDLSGQIAGVKNAPNPFGQFTTIMVESLTSGQFSFEVFNLVGKKVQDQTIQLTNGTNQFTFDAGELPNGTYYYSLGNGQGRVTNTFVINR